MTLAASRTRRTRHSKERCMDLEQVFIFDVGWFFFVAWGLVLAAVSVIAFGRDILPALPRLARGSDQR